MSRKTALYLSSLLRKCTPFSAISQAKQCHAQILVHGFLSDVTLQTDLLFVYSRCGFLLDARQVFDRMVKRNMHSWNILIASYVDNSLNTDAIIVFNKFKEMGLQPDHYTLPPLFKASAGIGDTSLGKMFHGWVIRLGFEEHVIVGSSVLEFYVKCGIINDARRVFSNMSCKDSVVWNLMISGFGRAGFCSDAITCFREMLFNGSKMGSMTVPSILNVCGKQGDLMKGKEIHGHVVKSSTFSVDAAIGNSLIDMYGKCGWVRGSEKVFRTMDDVNLVTWTTMISCFGLNGKGEESLGLFQKMIDLGFKPNPVTLTAVLASCSHAGLIDQGWRIFNSMYSDYGFDPSAEHYACVVDLLGRRGYLVEALRLLKNMKLPGTASIWGALLSGCMMHRNVEIGEVAAHHLFQLEPKNTSNYIALCSIYESRGIFDGVSRVRARMRDLGLVKTPGCSWIHIAGRVHKFYKGNISHPRTQMIYRLLCRIIKAQMLTNDIEMSGFCT